MACVTLSPRTAERMDRPSVMCGFVDSDWAGEQEIYFGIHIDTQRSNCIVKVLASVCLLLSTAKLGNCAHCGLFYDSGGDSRLEPSRETRIFADRDDIPRASSGRMLLLMERIVRSISISDSILCTRPRATRCCSWSLLDLWTVPIMWWTSLPTRCSRLFSCPCRSA